MTKIIFIDLAGISFSDGSVLTDVHYQDCCENVWADWNALLDYDLAGFEVGDVLASIECVPGSGFRIAQHFVPCYNQQNGYYSSDLSLVLTRPHGGIITLDITDCVEDQIN